MVNAMDGDGVLYQDDLNALGVRILTGYNSGFSNHNMPYTTGEVAGSTLHTGRTGRAWAGFSNDAGWERDDEGFGRHKLLLESMKNCAFVFVYSL